MMMNVMICDETYDNDYDTRHCKRISSTLKVPFDSKHNEINFEDVHIGNDVTVSQQREFVAMLRKHKDVFAKSKLNYGRTDLVKFTIDTGDARPVRSGLRRMSPPQRETVEKQVQEFLEDGIVEPASGEYSSPVVLVKKKSGEMRFCVDYRRLNAVTLKDSYPLPRIDDTLDTLSNSKYFSILDMQAAYMQVEIDPKDWHKTAFISHCGMYQFKVMPFGVSNAPAVFLRLINLLLSGLNWDICIAYLDDIIIMSSIVEQHIDRTDHGLQRIEDAGLKLNLHKCHFLQQSVEYLGHIVSSSGISPSPNKVKAAHDFPQPGTPKQVRSFLGLLSYVRKFIPNFSTMASPLYKLTEKNFSFVWKEEHQNKFDALKKNLAEDAVLAYADFKKQFQVTTDASSIGLGAIFSQVQDDSNVRQ